MTRLTSIGLKQWWELVKKAAVSWSDDYAASMGAALSYYTAFSIAPLVLIVISVAGLVFGEDAARGAIFGQLQGLMGREGADAVQAMLASVKEPGDSVMAAAIGIVVLLIGATTVFGELQDALDRIWRAPVRPDGGVWNLLRARLLSFGMILGIGFLLMVSLVASAALSALGNWWSPLFGGWELLAQAANFIVGFALVTAVFAMIYKIMPRVSVEWRDVLLGSAVTSMLFSIGKLLIGLYIGKSGVASGYGAAGSLVVLLVWVYYSAQIFLLGAEFTWVYASTYGSRRDQAAPVESAVPLQRQALAASATSASSGQQPANMGPADLDPLPSAATLARSGLVFGAWLAFKLVISAWQRKRLQRMTAYARDPR